MPPSVLWSELRNRIEMVRQQVAFPDWIACICPTEFQPLLNPSRSPTIMKSKPSNHASLLVRWMLLLGALCAGNLLPAQSLEKQLLAEKPAALAAEALRTGDPVLGAAVFYGQAMAEIIVPGLSPPEFVSPP